MHTVVLGFGSNMSIIYGAKKLCPVDILDEACIDLQKILSDVQVSSIYKTKALYVTDQDDFYNMVVVGNFAGTPSELLLAVRKIERKFGRLRDKTTINKGPRPLDIDIELFGACIVDTFVKESFLDEENVLHEENLPLKIPHELMRERQFVLIPLLEILPKSADPITGKAFSAFLASLQNQGVQLWRAQKH